MDMAIMSEVAVSTVAIPIRPCNDTNAARPESDLAHKSPHCPPVIPPELAGVGSVGGVIEGSGSAESLGATPGGGTIGPTGGCPSVAKNGVTGRALVRGGAGGP